MNSNATSVSLTGNSIDQVESLDDGRSNEPILLVAEYVAAVMIWIVQSVISIAIALSLIVIVPGPNVFAVTTSAMADRRRGVMSALGVSTGDMIWATAALVGIGALLANARPVFEVVRWAGVAYLVWFAIRLWRADPDDHEPTTIGARRPFLNGLLIDLANPKAAIFFSTLFSSLLPLDFGVGYGTVVLAVVAAIVYGWYLFLALVLSQPRIQVAYRRATKAINRTASVVIAGFGARLALDA